MTSVNLDRVDTAPLTFIPALDGMRGVAIIIVMLHNLSVTGSPRDNLLAAALQWGWIGVQLFFVLSGFLITRILLETGQAPGALGAFMVRRALRIMPLYYATLLVYFLVLPRVLDAPTVEGAVGHQLWYWLYLSNWTDPLGLGAPGLGHFWSLAVEAQFYLVWPLLVIGLKERRLLAVCLLVIVLAEVAQIVMRFAWGFPTTAVYKFTVTRMSALAVGGLAALLARTPSWHALFARNLRWLAWTLVAALTALALGRRGFDYRDPFVQAIGFLPVSLLFAAWLLVIALKLPVLGGVLRSWPMARPLRALGRISYGMYVFHYPLHWAAMKPLHPYFAPETGLPGVARLGAYVVVASAVTAGLALLSWRLFESPVMALKRFFPARRAAS